MWRPGQVETCVFCGRVIGPDEPSAGRGDSAAHATCADAAIGDDRLWEGIAAPTGDPDGTQDAGETQRDGGDPRPAAPASAARGGCSLVLALLVLPALTALAGTARGLGRTRR